MGPALPRWDLHLACGISVSVLCAFCAALPFIESGTLPMMGDIPTIAIPILIGTMTLLIGSILPDIDGKGRIRWIIGPVIGSFALVLMTMRAWMAGGLDRAFAYMADDGALVFLLATVFGYGSLLIPMKHRGIMHRKTSAIAFSVLCSAFFMIALEPEHGTVAMVGTMAFLGYCWHIALDGSI